MRIPTSEIDELTEDGKNAAAVSLGRKGGQARAQKLTKRQRVEIAKKGGAATMETVRRSIEIEKDLEMPLYSF